VVTVRAQIPTGQWYHAGGEPGWWFDAGSVALDFAWSGGTGGTIESIPDAAALSRWIGGRFVGVETAATDRDLRDARELRASIARIATAIAHGGASSGSDVDVVNLFAATPDIPPALAGGSRQAGRSRVRVSQALSAMARDAVLLFDEPNASADGHSRVRACAADDCDLVFYDESRSNNRRWCSMQRCGNRAKVRTHRLRAADAKSADIKSADIH
jgi:predicted RNA-binding Zn ribbon-like protein